MVENVEASLFLKMAGRVCKHGYSDQEEQYFLGVELHFPSRGDAGGPRAVRAHAPAALGRCPARLCRADGPAARGHGQGGAEPRAAAAAAAPSPAAALRPAAAPAVLPADAAPGRRSSPGWWRGAAFAGTAGREAPPKDADLRARGRRGGGGQCAPAAASRSEGAGGRRYRRMGQAKARPGPYSWGRAAPAGITDPTGRRERGALRCPIGGGRQGAQEADDQL